MTQTDRTSCFLPEEVSAQADDRVLGGVQTYVTFKGAVLASTVARGRTARSGTLVVRGRGGTGDWRGAGGGHFKIAPVEGEVKGGVATPEFGTGGAPVFQTCVGQRGEVWLN